MDIADASLHPDLCRHSFSSNLAGIVPQMKGNMCVKIRGWEVGFFFPATAFYSLFLVHKVYRHILSKISIFTDAELE